MHPTNVFIRKPHPADRFIRAIIYRSFPILFSTLIFCTISYKVSAQAAPANVVVPIGHCPDQTLIPRYHHLRIFTGLPKRKMSGSAYSSVRVMWVLRWFRDHLLTILRQNNTLLSPPGIMSGISGTNSAFSGRKSQAMFPWRLILISRIPQDMVTARHSLLFAKAWMMIPKKRWLPFMVPD